MSFTSQQVRSASEWIKHDPVTGSDGRCTPFWSASLMLDELAARLERDETEAKRSLWAPHDWELIEKGIERGRLEIYQRVAQCDPESTEADRVWCMFCSASQLSLSSEPLPHQPDCLWLIARQATDAPK